MMAAKESSSSLADPPALKPKLEPPVFFPFFFIFFIFEKKRVSCFWFFRARSLSPFLLQRRQRETQRKEEALLPAAM